MSTPLEPVEQPESPNPDGAPVPESTATSDAAVTAEVTSEVVAESSPRSLEETTTSDLILQPSAGESTHTSGAAGSIQGFSVTGSVTAPHSAGHPGENRSTEVIAPPRHSQKWALWLIAILAVAKILVEHTKWGASIDEKTFEYLQSSLYNSGISKQPTVVVIDRAPIIVKPFENGARTATSRTELKKYMQAMADSGAQAIGVDIDFSPEPDPHDLTKLRYIHPGDADFFKWCLRLKEKKHIRVGLGVYRTRADPPHWLYDSQFKDLAALIAVPTDRPGEKIDYYVGDPQEWPLPSMSALLAGVGHTLIYGRRESLDWLVESYTSERRAGEIVIGYSIFDPSSLQRLIEDHREPQTAAAIRDDHTMVNGRIVLLGAVRPSNPGDIFQVPGVGPTPGVYIIAAGAETLLHEPLRRFTSVGRILVDAVLSLLIFGVVHLLNVIARPATDLPGHWREIVLHGVITLSVIALVTIMATLVITKTRLLWTDFILVCLFLFLHWLIESFLLHRLEQLYQRVMRLFGRRSGTDAA